MASEDPRILLTNDDGIDSPGLASLYQALQSVGPVRVVAAALVADLVDRALDEGLFDRDLPCRNGAFIVPRGRVL